MSSGFREDPVRRRRWALALALSLPPPHAGFLGERRIGGAAFAPVASAADEMSLHMVRPLLQLAATAFNERD